MRYIVLCLTVVLTVNIQAQKSELSIDEIMKGHEYVGYLPENVRWSYDSKSIIFDRYESDSTFMLNIATNSIKNITNQYPPHYSNYNLEKNKAVWQSNGDIFYFDFVKNEKRQITSTEQYEYGPFFIHSNKIGFYYKNNLYSWSIKNGEIVQITNFKKGVSSEDLKTDYEKWLEKDQMKLFQVLKENENQSKTFSKPIFIGQNQAHKVMINPDETVISYVLSKKANDDNNTKVPHFVTSDGYTYIQPARKKVGSYEIDESLFIYNLKKDTVFKFDEKNLPGINKNPDYYNEYANLKEIQNETRPLSFSKAIWSPNGKNCIFEVRSSDNKDRWFVLLNAEDGTYETIDHQRDEAWIAGPGIGWARTLEPKNWLSDSKHFYFQSEETGHSHLYIINIETKEKFAVTRGDFQVYNPVLSKDQKYWYLTTNKENPGIKHLYKVPLFGGEMEQLSSMKGINEAVVSPNEKLIALKHSYSNKPTELFLQKNKAFAEVLKLSSFTLESFNEQEWIDPKIIKFEARDKQKVFARLYTPDKNKNGALVVFVHGAGYMQNVHFGWSRYFREFMFHNYLVNNGYTVIDIDYRGSAGYGRDFRTGNYRHMGGKDLTDIVDGVEYVIQNYDIDANKVGIYGGSYGGFITLMAMFQFPEVFKSGAALRSVTDWAHYNQGYTSNILNLPHLDTIAYKRSSPIYFAQGLEGHLLMCHGMVDDNVQFQDIVRLSQKLIELGKENWELAVYPVESHAFKFSSSWTDEYKRIYKLFENTIGNQIE